MVEEEKYGVREWRVCSGVGHGREQNDFLMSFFLFKWQAGWQGNMEMVFTTLLVSILWVLFARKGGLVIFLGGDLKEKEWPWFLYPIVVISSDFLSIPCIICFCLDELVLFLLLFLAFLIDNLFLFLLFVFRFLPRVSS